MSVVVGFSFPEEAIIISDSRISSLRNGVIEKTQDNLRKIFALTPQLAIGFVSGDVEISYKLISKLQEYIRFKSKNKITYYLLQRLPKVARYEYLKLTGSMKQPPAMDFMFAGILGDRPFHLPEKVVMEELLSKSGAFPEPFGKALMTMSNGIMTIEPPTPVIMMQSFPSGRVSDFGIYTTSSIGSGASIGEVFGKEYSTLLTCDPAPIGTFRSNYIRIICDEFIKDSKISTIGGAIQVLRINAKGISGVKSSFKRIFSDNRVEDISEMEFDGEKWTYINHEIGKTDIIESFLPEILK